MTTELILMVDVEGLGPAGTVVKVANGYARNCLVPQKLAAPVSRQAMKQLEKNRAEREAQQEAELKAAQSLAAAIEQASCTIPMKVGENEKLYGSVTVGDILDALAKQKIELDKHSIRLDEPIRELGVYTIKIELHSEVEAKLKVWVVEE